MLCFLLPQRGEEDSEGQEERDWEGSRGKDGMISDCRGSLGAQSLFVGLPGKFGERSGVPGAHGLCRASFGENQAGLEEKVQGVGMEVRGLPWPPPQTTTPPPEASEPKGHLCLESPAGQNALLAMRLEDQFWGGGELEGSGCSRAKRNWWPYASSCLV